MPATYEDEYEDDYVDDEKSTPKALRDHVKKIEKQLKDLQAKLEETEKARDEAVKANKSFSLRDLLAENHVDAKFAPLAERDGVEATPEGIAAWIEEHKDLYNFQTVTPDDDVDDSEPDTLSPDLVNGLNQMGGVESAGQAPGSTQIESKLNNFDVSKYQDFESLAAALAEMGAPRG